MPDITTKNGQIVSFNGKVAFFSSKTCVLNNLLGPKKMRL